MVTKDRMKALKAIEMFKSVSWDLDGEESVVAKELELVLEKVLKIVLKPWVKGVK